MKSNISLFGFMGAGKSSVGRKIASISSLKFVETDELIKLRCEKSISQIFSVHGEAYFRAVEVEVVNAISQNEELVISTGGGVIENSANLSALSVNSVPFFLHASFEALWARINLDSHIRPLGKSKEQTLGLFNKRKTLYERIPNIILTESLTVEAVSEKVYSKFLELKKLKGV